MRELSFCFGNSRQASKWYPDKMTFDELCEKLKNPIRTPETTAQYHKMTKAEKDQIKDKGGFLAGQLKGTKRKKTEVISRSMITLDCDKVKSDFFDTFTSKYMAVIYTTHSHLPTKPRIRILIPLARDVSPEEYNAIARYTAEDIGMDIIDPCSFEINQLMYLPSCPSDGEYICRTYGKDWLNPDMFLSEHPDWRNCADLPSSPEEKKIIGSHGKKQEDPLSKEGIVGVFCRTYTIQEAIKTFLSDIYAPSDKDDRYDYISGEGVPGVVIYDDKFAYSHHATDPAGGKLLNAFDLVRIHMFGDADNKTSFLKMCSFAENDKNVREVLMKEKKEQAKRDFMDINSAWEEPLLFGKHTSMKFPLETLPENIRNFVAALSESVQTPIDMAGCAVLSIIAAAVQGKYVIQGKKDWQEPLNIYLTEIAPPSERKSAIQHAIVKPMSDYENNYNRINAAAIESSKMHKRILERKQKAIEDQFVKGKAEQADVDKIAEELTSYTERKPLRLFADDITPEKLASVLSENNGRMALLSSEAGIFDTLAGAYSKSVNIDVMLKSYSGDQIRVDRIGRESENIINPTLTVLLMAQPNIISKVLSNKTFRGRGLTARFLYCMPTSNVGERKYRSKPVPDEIYLAYEKCISNLLEDEYLPEPEIITLSSEADSLMEIFSQELEPKLINEYAEISDWCGKLAGNVLRIAGLLCRAENFRCHDFLEEQKPLVVDGRIMNNAIKLGKYFLSHAQTVFNVLPEDNMFQNANRILKMIREKKLKKFNRRTAMRHCQTFKRVEEIQPILDFLEDYGYIAAVENNSAFGKGRPPMPKYLVNPLI